MRTCGVVCEPGVVERRYLRILDGFLPERRDVVFSELQHLRDAFMTDKKQWAFLAKALSRRRLRKVVGDFAYKGGFSAETRSFLDALACYGRLGCLPNLLKVLALKGKEAILLETAQPLAHEDVEKKEQEFGRFLGQDVQLIVSHNAALLGGDIIMWRGKMFDTSLSTMLKDWSKRRLNYD